MAGGRPGAAGGAGRPGASAESRARGRSLAGPPRSPSLAFCAATLPEPSGSRRPRARPAPLPRESSRRPSRARPWQSPRALRRRLEISGDPLVPGNSWRPQGQANDQHLRARPGLVSAGELGRRGSGRHARPGTAAARQRRVPSGSRGFLRLPGLGQLRGRRGCTHIWDAACCVVCGSACLESFSRGGAETRLGPYGVSGRGAGGIRGRMGVHTRA